MENQNPLQNGALEGAAGNGGRSGDGSALIFLGTGCSSAVPNAMCLIQPSDPPCQVCSQSLSIPPDRNPNYSIATKFPYLVQKKLREGQEVRRVAQLDWKIIEEHYDKPFVASGLKFFPLPVMHGEDYLCLGYLFGEKCKVAYISDVSRFPSNTEYVISKNGAGQLDLLILDCLYKKGSFNVHLCLPQTLEAIKRICPKRALLIGMTHEFDHHKDNEFLMEWSEREGIHIQLARDGLRVPIDL
ncbi:hypothetical protein ERO13_D06G144600v2 [Gossypium hirsutum]|nr:hypothetical protein ERO13_D06G144600v2 [Gossypium hirsutum]KAG4142690.1 hypothetical protein ERO13_D06G144600v2 [Gossypium hirsutum]